MEQGSVYYDRIDSTLPAWFDDPKKEYVCEEIDDVVLTDDLSGHASITCAGN